MRITNDDVVDIRFGWRLHERAADHAYCQDYLGVHPALTLTVKIISEFTRLWHSSTYRTDEVLHRHQHRHIGVEADETQLCDPCLLLLVQQISKGTGKAGNFHIIDLHSEVLANTAQRPFGSKVIT